MNKLLYLGLSCLFLFSADMLKADGLTFFKGKFEKAKLVAQNEKKAMLLYFKLKGAAPCEFMEKEVFTNDTLGEFYNDNFLNYQIEANEKNLSLIKSYSVEEVPMYVWVNIQGEEIYRMSGEIQPSVLLQIGRIVTGESPSLEDLFEKMKAEDYFLESMQALLLEALSFLPILNDKALDYWTGEVKVVYEKYLSNKQMSDMVNAEDFKILTSYVDEAKMFDPVFEFILDNYDAYKMCVPEDEIAGFLMDRHMELIGRLTYMGNDAYAEVVDRIEGDLAKVYSHVESHVGMDTVMRYQADADYWLHGKKNLDAYVDSKNEYFKVLGGKLRWQDLYNAVNDLRKACNDQFTEKAFSVCMAWIEVVEAQKDIEDGVRLWAQLTKGDCYLKVCDNENAKSFYNQAYVIAMQLKKQDVQDYLKRKVAALEQKKDN